MSKLHRFIFELVRSYNKVSNKKKNETNRWGSIKKMQCNTRKGSLQELMSFLL